MFGRFEVIVGKLRGVGVVYNDSEKDRHILNSLDPIYEMRKIAIQESHKPDELTVDMLFSKLKTHQIASEGRNPPRNRTLALVSSGCQTAHGSSSISESGSGPSSGFSLACLVSVSDEQLESLPEDDLALFVRRFSRAYKNVRERKGKHTKICFECGVQGHYRSDCPNLKDYGENSGGKNNYIKKKSFSRHETKFWPKAEKHLQKMVAAIASGLQSAVDLSDIDSDQSGEDDPPSPKGKDTKKKKADRLTGMCFMAHEADEENDNTDEVQMSYDELYAEYVKVENLFLTQAKVLKKCTRTINDNLAQIDSLTLEITTLKDATASVPSHDIDDCAGCDVLHAELELARNTHASMS